MSKQNKTDAVQSIAELQESPAKRDSRIEELGREIERLASCQRFESLYHEAERELAAMKARQSGWVVLPERRSRSTADWIDLDRTNLAGDAHSAGWNACLDEVARLNSSPVSAGDDESRHDAVKALHDVMQAVPCASLYSLAEAVLDAGYVNPASAGGVDERAAFEDAMHEDAEISGCDADLSTLNRTVDGRLIYANPITQACWWAWNQRAALNAGSAVPDGWQPSGIEYDRGIHHNPDAKAWADLFVATFPALADKHDLMLGWFANAMMAMHDFLKAKQPNGEVLDWAVERWHAEVSQRPLINVHRRALDGAWRQVIRKLGGDPVDLCGPDHSTLLAAAPTAKKEG